MRRLALSLALVVAAAPSAACADGSTSSYLPLKQGNRWTYQDARTGGETTVTAARVRPGVFRLEGFPGASSLCVRWSGGVLQAWDGGQRRWESFLRLGAPKGTAYRVDLPHPLWEQVRVTVASRTATVKVDPLERSFSRAVRLTLRPSPELSDAGITSMVFAPGVGLVLWEELTFTGTVTHALSSARVGDRTLGRR
ncbi:MAG: hypothetical protein WD067_02955 [Gaiellaceae bacterium]